MSKTTIMLAAGGTGGHLFPAFALAEELDRRGCEVDLVTDMRGDRYGTGFPARQVHQVPSATIGGKSPAAVAKTVWMLSRGIAAAHRLIGRIKPAVVVGFGGYPTFPPLLAASLRGVPTLLHEQNAVLGRANRMLAGRVSAIATSFENTRHLEGALAAKTHMTGNPVRDVVLEAARTPYQAPTADGPLRLVVFGGSQGARYFSDVVPPAVIQLPEAVRARITVVQQCRDEDLERVRDAYASAGVAAELAAFFKDLPQRIAHAHLVIGRAGASTVAELTAIGRPGLLVPLPHALDNDQLQNATRLAESGGGWCFEQKGLSPERLAEAIVAFAETPERLLAAAEAARRQGRPDAVSRLADIVSGLSEGRAS